MQREPVAVAFSIVRNSVALMAVGLLAKGMGLVLAVLIARFLGPASMGLFALLFSIALLTEYVAPLGLQDVLIREVAARPRERVKLWRQAATLAVCASLLPSAAFLVAAWHFQDQPSTRACLVTLAIGMPFSALALVSQSALQGMEKVLYLTWTTFITRVASLALLVLMLMKGMGVESAFISRVLFQAASAALFVVMILRDAPPHEDSGRPHIDLRRAMPFAVNRLVTESTTRAPLLLLPVLFTLAQIGIFDAADRIRLTLGIMVAVATTAIMPALSRSFADEGTGSRDALVSFSTKYVCLALSAAALVISIFADAIVHLLYGAKFAQSALLLQVLVWTQVIVATDTVLKQTMIANGREYAVAVRALIGIACLAALVIGLGYLFGLIGAAAGVLTAAFITIAMDTHFVSRNVLDFDAGRFLLKPLAAALAAGAVLVALDGSPLVLRLAAGVGTYGALAFALRLVPAGERAFLREALNHGFRKRATKPAVSGD